MALVGSISGSSGFTALTGTLLPGVATNELGSTTARWNTVHSNFVTGTLRKTAGGNDFIIGGPNVTANYNSLGQWEITGAGGGGGAGVFTEASSVAAYTTSSIAIGFSAAASSKGSDVFFAVSGSNTSSNTALFSGPIVTSASFTVKDLANGNTVASITGVGAISGSALQTVGNLAVQGTSALTGDVTVTGDVAVNGGDLTTTSTSATLFNANATTVTIAGGATTSTTVGNATGGVTLNGSATVTGDLAVNGATSADITTTTTAATLFNTTATTVSIAGGATAGTNIGNASGLTTIAGGVKVSGNFISGSASKNLTLGSGGDVTVEGDLTVSGNDIVFAAATGNIANAATTLTIGSGATTLNIGSASGRVVVPGDLEVQGTTMTVSASNLVIEDPLVGFGFLSGSVATTAGDRGFIGGISGSGNNVAFGWSNSNSAFVATRTTSSPEDATITVSALQPVRASKLEVNGTSAYVTSSDGLEIQVVATNVATVKSTSDKVALDGATNKGISFNIAGSQFAELKNDASSNAQFGAVGGKELTVSGSTVSLNTGGTVNVLSNGSRIGQLGGIVGNSFKVLALDTAGVTKNLILSGSSLDLGANSFGISLNFADSTRGAFTYGANALTLSTSTGVALALSGTNGISLTHGTQGAQFINVGGSPAYMVIEGDGPDARLRSTADLVLRADGADVKFASGANTPLTFSLAGGNANIQGAANQQVNIGAVGSGGMTVSGSTVTANAGAGGFVFQRDGVAELLVNATTNTTTISGSTDQNVILAAGTGATTLALSGSTVNNQATIAHKFNLGGTLISHVTSSNGRQGIFPGADSTFDLGGPSVRWAHIYTGDLHLRNERGDYTLIEEPDFLSVRFNKNGKRYKFLLERVPELDETR